MAVELDMERWEEILGCRESLDKVHVIVSNLAVTSEVVGQFEQIRESFRKW